MADKALQENHSKQKVQFNSDTLLRFIALYRKNECLWNVRLEEYKKHDKRKNVMAEIALELNLSEDFVKKKIQSLRSTYIQERKKIEETKTTGTGSDDVYSPSLYWFHELEFLNDVIVPRKTSSNLENQTQINEEVDQNQNALQRDSQQPGTSKQTNVSLPKVKMVKKTKKPLNPQPEDACIQLALENLSRFRSIENNEFQIFGTSVAAQLQAMPILDAVETQMEIQQMLTAKRLKLLREAKRFKPPSRSSQANESSEPHLMQRSQQYELPSREPFQSPHESSPPHFQHSFQSFQNQHDSNLRNTLRSSHDSLYSTDDCFTNLSPASNVTEELPLESPENENLRDILYKSMRGADIDDSVQ